MPMTKAVKYFLIDLLILTVLSNVFCCEGFVTNFRSLRSERSTKFFLKTDLRNSKNEDLENKIARLKAARERGKSYKEVIGDGKALSEKIQKLGQRKSNEEEKLEEEILSKKVYKGKNKVSSELLEGKRSTIIEDKSLDFVSQNEQGMDFVGKILSDFDKNENSDKDYQKKQKNSSQERAESTQFISTDKVTNVRKPSVSTWGIFERPNNISKSFGGGRDPRFSVESTEEINAKRRYTDELLKKYRYGSKGDQLLEDEPKNSNVLTEALKSAKLSIRFGDRYGAVSSLENVEGLCSYRGVVGSEVLLELAMALEYINERDRAVKMYKDLSKMAPSEVRKQARGLKYGIDAMEKLKFEANDKQSELKKIWDANPEVIGKITDKRYDNSFVEKDADGRATKGKVMNVKEALVTFKEASKREGRGISKFRVHQSAMFIYDRWSEARLAAEKSQEYEDNESINDSVVGKKKPLKGAGLFSLVGEAASVNSRMESEWKLQFQVELGNGSEGIKYLISSKCTMILSSDSIINSSETFALFARSKRNGRWNYNPFEISIGFEWEPKGFFPSIHFGKLEMAEDRNLMLLNEDSLVLLDPLKGSKGTVTYWQKV
mmetsp:Transcript_7473/g.11172  ORF Transcript_7473/g.11172 Transcript_7473/m.11172 type:complete len:605 (+) Transcript_7473:61-1875(+)